jgi:chemotaxis protein CheY-P-specific phosphatase CheC
MKKIGRDYVNVSTPLDGLFFSFLSFFLQAMCNLLGIKESKRLQWLELAMSSIKELKKNMSCHFLTGGVLGRNIV